MHNSDRMLETLLGNLPGMVCRFKNDLDWTMEYMSQGCYELTEYQPFELINNNFTSYGKITILEDNLDAWNTIQNALKHKERYQLEYRIKTKSGKEKWIWEQGIGIFDTNNELTCIEAFMTDITSQKNTEIENKLLIDELNERNEELDNFVYKVSHDLRAPLLSIKGLTQLLKLENSISVIPEYSDRIINTIDNLDEFSRKMLHYARAKKSITYSESINFEKLIQESLTSAGFCFQHEKFILFTDIKTNTDIYSDYFRLKSILSNIYSNAIKYKDNSKKISFVKTEIFEDTSTFTIVISDNGIGIDDESKKDIFKMFFRGTEISDGSGLGLYITKLNVEKLNGNIMVDNLDSETGTVFTLIFPKTKK